MKNKILVAFILLSSFGSFAQQYVTWQDLSKVTFVDKYYPEYGQSFLFPNFSPSVKALNGKKITITGYFLDLDPSGEVFFVSKGSMASCFFCGIGGPETAIEVRFKKKPSFKIDDIVTVTGIFSLNDSDVQHFNYILTESEGKLVD